MPMCAASGCSNATGKTVRKSGPKLSFYHFPFTRPKLLEKWLENLGREGYRPSKHARLCSDHFLESCFQEDMYAKYVLTPEQRGKRYRRLKVDAVPTEFPHRTESRIRQRYQNELEKQPSTSTEDHQKTEGPYPAVLFKRISPDSVPISAECVAVNSRPLPSYLQDSIFPPSVQHMLKVKRHDPVVVKTEPLDSTEFSEPEPMLTRDEHKDLTCASEPNRVFPVKLGVGGIVPPVSRCGEIVPEQIRKSRTVPVETSQGDIFQRETKQNWIAPVEMGKDESVSAKDRQGGTVEQEVEQYGSDLVETRAKGGIVVDTEEDRIAPVDTTAGEIDREETEQKGIVPGTLFRGDGASITQTGEELDPGQDVQDGVLLPTAQDGVYILQAEENVLRDIQNGEDGIFLSQNDQNTIARVQTGPQMFVDEGEDITQVTKQACERDHCYIRLKRNVRKRKGNLKLTTSDPAIKYLTEEINKLDCRRVTEGRQLCAKIQDLQYLLHSKKIELAELRSSVKFNQNLVKKLLKEKRQQAKEKERLVSKCLSIKLLQKNKQLCKRYTGFPNYDCVRKLFEFLRPQAESVGTKQKSTFCEHRKMFCGKRRNVSLEEEFLISLIKLKTKMPFFDLARQFGLTSSRVSDTVLKWAHILQDSLGQCSDNLEYPCSEDIRSWVQRYITKHKRSKNFISVDTSQSDTSHNLSH